MYIDHGLQHFRKHSRFGRILCTSLLLAAMALQPMSAAWAAEGLTSSQTWHVLNETGIDLLGVQRLRITGPDAAAFTIEGYTGSPVGMTPSQDIVTPSLVQKTPSTPLGVNLRFTPQHSGDHQANLEVTHDGSNASPASYPLKGAGAWDVTAQASTNTIDFGEQAMGMPAMTQDAFVRAVGAHGWLKVTGAKLEGSPDFTLAQTGLVNKGSATWGTGANLEVLPAGAIESTKTFAAADVSVGGFTDGAVRVRYTPTLRGPQTATLTVYHDGPGGESVIPVIGDGARATSVELRGNSPFAATAVGVGDFGRVGLDSAILSKTVYLKTLGAFGRVTYTGFKVEGATNITVAKAGLIYNSGNGYDNGKGRCVVTSSLYDGPTYSSSVSYGANEGQEASFYFKGGSVNAIGQECVSPGKDFGLVVSYNPSVLGRQAATITVYHDGNDEGFTAFDISGEAFRDASVELRGNSPFAPIAVGVGDFSRVKLDGASQTKTVYLRSSGTYGKVVYKGFKIEGAPDFTVTKVGLIYNSGNGYNNGNGRCIATSSLYDGPTYSSSISYGLTDGRAASFSLEGISVTAKDKECVFPGKDFGLIIRYTPITVGKQTATVTIYHDGNAQGFTIFDISGEAY